MSFILQPSAAAALGTQITATASGALAAGDIVVANSDGTVSVVSAVAGALASAGITVNKESIGIAYDVSQSKSLAFGSLATPSTLYAFVVTTTGNSVSLGSLVTAVGSNATFADCVYDANAQKIVCLYYNSAPGTLYLYAIVGTISGTTATFGSPVAVRSAISQNAKMCYDATAQKILIVADADIDLAVVGTVSGTSISFGTALNVSGSISNWGCVPGLVHDANATNNVMVYKTSSGFSVRANVLTISGTSVTAGSATTIETDSSITVNDFMGAVYSSVAQKIVVYYYLNSSNITRAAVGTVSGTSVSFGSITSSSFANARTASYDPNANKVAVYGVSGSDTAMQLGTISGTSISFGSLTVVSSGVQLEAFPPASTYDASQQRVVVVGRFGSATEQVLATYPGFKQLTTSNFIGFASGAYSSGQTATINCIGCIQTLSGLTPGLAYYCLQNNTLSSSAGSPSVFAGTAYATTKLIVKG